MHEIAKHEFEGHAIPEYEIEGSRRVIICADLARALGLTESGMRKIIERNQSELPSSEVWRDKLSRQGQTRTAWVCDRLGAHHLAILASTPEGARARQWTLATFIKPYLSGARMVTPDEFQAMKGERDFYKKMAGDAVPIMTQNAVAIEHFARAHRLGLEYSSALLRHERGTRGARAVRALKDDTKNLFAGLTKSDPATATPSVDPGAPVEARILAAIREAVPPLRDLKGLRKAVAAPARDVEREFKFLVNLGKVDFGPSGEFVVRELPNRVVPTNGNGGPS